ncbi:pesticidal protein [Bacillus thuringiensis]|uniref:insecticidal delta-endotoxin Cry8Ea1 family protein n=1 Tax=Bacillus thuringiensis TaxID=1428 RepID=UPI0009BA1239|nr:insecticidal delta-endotoxin Cry8Ea1 family protein [Bacillus thuringiensis]AXY95017.1 Cry69Ab-like protein [Bacillus thuringiensis]MBZ8126132.1 pesticidal protein [Bacillus thuringiensis]
MNGGENMNQNNQNEIEILDTASNDLSQSSGYPRYPLAKDSKVPFENSNYKDWLANCEKSNADPLLTEEDLRTALFTSINITTSLLNYLGLGPIATGVNILGSIFGFLWPNPNELNWVNLIRVVESLIAREITQLVIGNATSKLEGLQSVVSIYYTAFNHWNESEASRLDDKLKERVRLTFGNVDSALAEAMPQFRQEHYEQQLLLVYAQAANMHLLVLRDAVIHGEAWGYSSVTVDGFYNRQVSLIDAYTEHCMSFYRQGLQDLRNRGNWNAFNNYRRNMTIALLDIISLFSNYDGRVYRTSTPMQLTREVYTEPISNNNWGNLGLTAAQFQQVENDLIRPPSLFSIFNGATMEAAQLFVGGSGPVHTIQRFYIRSRTSGPNSGHSTSPWIGRLNFPTPSQTFNLDLNTNEEIFRISSIASTYSTGSGFGNLISGLNQVLFFSTLGLFDTRVTDFNLDTPFRIVEKESHLPGRTNTVRPGPMDYSHRLSWISATSAGLLSSSSMVPAYGWTHISAERTNQLLPDRITQFPAVKSLALGGTGSTVARVISGPGHTGGALIAMSGHSALEMRFNSPSRQKYHIRIRFVNDFNDVNCRIDSITIPINSVPFVMPGSRASVNPNLSVRDFRYVTVPGEFEVPSTSYGHDLLLETLNATGTCLIDKIEFIPVNSTTLEYEGKQNLEKAKKAVDNLFTNNGREALKVDTMDYDVDQAANLVECVPEELYTKEKMILLDEVKHAKQLSASRNLIQNGNFEFYTDEWTTSNNVSIQADNPIFKGNYLKMPGARETGGDTTRFPTYVLQKIDESKLKPYTRYKARGFVGSSHNVRLIVERYGKEVDVILNVRNDLALNTVAPFRIEVNQCQSQTYPIIRDGCLTNVIDTNYYEGAQSGHANFKKEHGMCHQSHQFDFHIDTGEVHLNKNPGIWVLFKISSPEGHATLDNIELIEDGPLVGESLTLVKKREKKWKNEMGTRWLQTKEVYEKAKGEIDALFTDAQDQYLKFDTNLSHIISAEHLVQSTPYVYNKWLSDMPGMNYDIYTELERRITQAYSLYERRNIIKNGDFDHDLNHWHATPHAKVQQIDGTAVLVIPNWSSNVSQNVCLENNRGYVLRVTAKKEDMGKGYVTISDCNGNQETLTFTSCANYVSNEITNEQSEYPFSQEMNEQRCYNPNETINGQRNYVTRTIDFFPDTDQVRIDIGETEGIFKVESVELICMKSQ